MIYNSIKRESFTIVRTLAVLLVLICFGGSLAAQESKKVIMTKAIPLHKVSGVIKDKGGAPLLGATVVVSNDPKRGAVADAKGKYTILVESPTASLTFSYVGMVTATVPITSRAEINVTLEMDENYIGNVIITGLAPKAKGSFTGTAVQVKGDELRSISPTSFLDAISVFDPSFNIVDARGLLGSNPNAIPDRIEIRGGSSLPPISETELKSYTNLPIFILDGFEIGVQQLFDLDINRIESLTILKDAAGASMYGSRAANGVVVIETKAPKEGAMQVSYTFNGTVETPDLSSYNLMNAAESLEYLRLSNVFKGITSDNSYQLLKGDIENGVNTYWLSQPLQTAFSQQHSLILEGGSKGNDSRKAGMRYMINLLASPSRGVMKGSERDRYNAGVKLIYNRRSKLQLSTDIQFGTISSTDSPYGKFSSYAELMPFYRMKDANGRYYPKLSTSNIPKPEGLISYASATNSQDSPIFDALYTDSYSNGSASNLSVNTGLNYAIARDLRLRGTFSINNTISHNKKFVSPLSSKYYEGSSMKTILAPADQGSDFNVARIMSRGELTTSNADQLDYMGNLILSYTKEIDKHLIQAVWLGELSQKSLTSDSYIAAGFLDGLIGVPTNSLGFQYGSRPAGAETIKRSVGTSVTMNYGWNRRYMVDLTGRMEASSAFAKNKRTMPFWSAGARWNLSNESFMKDVKFIRNIALKANIGTTSTEPFSLGQITTLYSYNTRLYDGMMGADIESLENPDLKWPITTLRDAGVEFDMFKGRLGVNASYFSKTTVDNVTDLSIAPSIGFKTYKANMGTVENHGIEFGVSITPIRTRDFVMNIVANGANSFSKIVKISESLREYNKKVMDQQTAAQGVSGQQATPAYFFVEGASLNTIYAVPSLGIDPGTGQEIYLKKNGEKTFVWDAADQVAVGVTEPKLRGFFSLNMDYKRWNFGSSLGYSFGGQKNNFTTLEKIETRDFTSNADRRALYDRWQKPGDISKFKAMGLKTKTPPTSRFIQDENYFTMNSVRLAYTLRDGKLLERYKISMIKIALTTNNLFYISSIKQERGVEYPFARQFFLTLNANF